MRQQFRFTPPWRLGGFEPRRPVELTCFRLYLAGGCESSAYLILSREVASSKRRWTAG
jgi:hypothetical protein